MKAQRHQIYAALFALAKGLPGIQTSGTRLQPWSKVTRQPAIFQTQIRERPEYGAGGGMPPKWILRVTWWLYVTGTDADGADMGVINDLVDAIEKLFPNEGPSGPRAYNTLGGLVNRVVISGEIKTDEGMLGPQAIAIVPLEIVAT